MLFNEDLTREILGAAIEVHRFLGPGLLESAYDECLCRELALRSIPFERQVEIPVVYKGFELPCGYRMDLVVADAVVLEIKSVARIMAVHEAQLLTYLKLAGKRVGFILNFNVALMRLGVVRKVL